MALPGISPITGLPKRTYTKRQPAVTVEPVVEVVVEPVVEVMVESVVEVSAEPLLTVEPKPVKVVDKRVKVKSRVIQRYHPFQHVIIPLDGYVNIPRDRWLDVQLKAGVVEIL